MTITGKTVPEWAVNLKKYRLENGYTQEEFGRYFDVSAMAVSYWESGRTEPPAKVLVWVLLAADVIAPESVPDPSLPPLRRAEGGQ